MEFTKDETIERYSDKKTEPKVNVSKRFAIVVSPSVQQQFAKLAKEHKVSQSVVAETLMEIADLQNLCNALATKKVQKEAGRSSKTSLLRRLTAMNAQQLAKLLAEVDQVKKQL